MKAQSETGVLTGALAGVVGGVVGSTAMVVFNHLLAATGFGRHDVGARKQDRHLRAKPNSTDGTIADEPASEKAASHLVEAVTGERLDDEGKKIGGLLAHHAFGAMTGAFYGAAVSQVPQFAVGGGAPYGALVWLTAAETAMPLTGLARRPWAYRPERHAASLATHLVFGLTLEATRRCLMPRGGERRPGR